MTNYVYTNAMVNTYGLLNYLTQKDKNSILTYAFWTCGDDKPCISGRVFKYVEFIPCNVYEIQ